MNTFNIKVTKEQAKLILDSMFFYVDCGFIPIPTDEDKGNFIQETTDIQNVLCDIVGDSAKWE